MERVCVTGGPDFLRSARASCLFVSQSGSCIHWVEHISERWMASRAGGIVRARNLAVCQSTVSETHPHVEREGRVGLDGHWLIACERLMMWWRYFGRLQEAGAGGR